ncbi:small integral membrane protein 14-like [Halichondria panicea]|uniref:small integral membrane protein 14-like n=1 Tax=Halichondria panicea TaxID=6063 RepID=UPI00312B7BD5
MDPYECVCEYIWSMRRLIAGLQTQNHCTDTECFSEHPGFESGQPNDGQSMNVALLLLVWLVVAVLLFLFRPARLRRSGDLKPRSQPDSNDGGPAPPTQ